MSEIIKYFIVSVYALCVLNNDGGSGSSQTSISVCIFMVLFNSDEILQPEEPTRGVYIYIL